METQHGEKCLKNSAGQRETRHNSKQRAFSSSRHEIRHKYTHALFIRSTFADYLIPFLPQINRILTNLAFNCLKSQQRFHGLL